jgi:hypothetical protein
MIGVQRHLRKDSSSLYPFHPLIRAFGPRDLHHAKGLGPLKLPILHRMTRLLQPPVLPFDFKILKQAQNPTRCAGVTEICVRSGSIHSWLNKVTYV